MRFTLRLLGAIWVSAMIVFAGFAFVAIRAERARLTEDLERRAWLLGEGLKEAVEPLVGTAGAGRRGAAALPARRGAALATPSRAA